ncbi:hypothetical protein T10_12215 [Trichinella papuae]|uniref:Uncharacterized protein n=1 Tax=Trichinella papuae TaxID=268474 RepID=A0A0V1M4X6_9BILA|nr:hypothetical protein T10_12215 [Trichinella papuae]
MDILIQEVLSGNATDGDLKRVNSVYAEKQQRVAQYTGEYTSGRRTLELFRRFHFLRLINNRCGRMSLVYEGKAYKLRYTSKQRKYWEGKTKTWGMDGTLKLYLNGTNSYLPSMPL